MTANIINSEELNLGQIDATLVKHGLVKRLMRDPAAVASFAILVVIAILAIAAPLITPYSPSYARLADALAPPFSPGHLLGADGVGKDVLTQLLYGAQTALVGAAIVVTVALLIGIPTGIVAGFYRGAVDSVSSWIANALLSLPAIVVLLVFLARVARNTELALVVFGVLIAPAAFFLVRASVRAVREELYIDAAKVSGLANTRVMRRHVLPVVIGPSVVQAALLAGAGIGVEAGLAYLGVGSTDSASWGLMLNDASQNIYNAPWLLIWPSAAIILTVTAFTLIANSVRDALGASTNGQSRSGFRKRHARARATQLSRHEGRSAVPAVDSTADEAIAVSNLTVSYPHGQGMKVVVHDVSLRLRHGEVLGLIGESGSGKSQTAFSILGLLPDSAEITSRHMRVAGRDAQSLTPAMWESLRGRQIGYIPQEPMSNLDPSFRIGHQLVQPMRIHLKLSRRAARAEALRLLARVGIAQPERVFRAYPHEISGGMAQRVLIAGAVSCNPKVLIADEPTTALDVTVQADVLNVIRALQTESGMAVLLVTHNFGVVADICDTVAVMRNGQIIESASAEQFFANPQSEYSKTLLKATLEGAPPRQERDDLDSDVEGEDK